MDARRLQQINLIASIALIFTIGATTGYAIGFFRATRRSFPEIKTVGEINPGTTTVKLMEVKNGILYGKISGREARLAYSADHILSLEKEQTFEIPISQIQLKNYYQASALPDEVQFIASKTGKYYYSVFDKRALNLSKKNRLMFKSAKEAESMGYVKK